MEPTYVYQPITTMDGWMPIEPHIRHRIIWRIYPNYLLEIKLFRWVHMQGASLPLVDELGLGLVEPF